MGTLDLSYALPESRIEVVTTTTEGYDSVLEKAVPATPQSVVSLGIGAAAPRIDLLVHTGWFKNAGVGLELTDDGRLKSSSLESTGEAGKVVLGVIGAATTVASIATGTGGLLKAAEFAKAPEGIVFDLEDAGKPETETPEEIEAKAFAAANPDAATQRSLLQELVTKTKLRLAAVAKPLGDDGAPDLAAMLTETKALTKLLAQLEAQLEPLNELFKAWRATTIKATQATVVRFLDLDTLRKAKTRVAAERVHFEPEKDGEDAAAKALWADLGVAVVITPIGNLVETTPERKPEINEVLVRIPRPVTIEVYEKDAGGKPRLHESRPQLVMDALCRVEAVKLRQSVWAKRSVEMKFSDLGALSSYKYQLDSAATAAAGTASSIPATIAEGLEKGGKINESITALSTAESQRQLAAVKAEVELKQGELSKAGLQATAADYARLERLKQRVALLENKKKAGELE